MRRHCRARWRDAALALAVPALVLSGCGSQAQSDPTGRVSWSRLLSLVRDCQARRVDQSHNRLVTVTLHGGRKAWGYEPRIDAIIAPVNQAIARCGPITFATE